QLRDVATLFEGLEQLEEAFQRLDILLVDGDQCILQECAEIAGRRCGDCPVQVQPSRLSGCDLRADSVQLRLLDVPWRETRPADARAGSEITGDDHARRLEGAAADAAAAAAGDGNVELPAEPSVLPDLIEQIAFGLRERFKGHRFPAAAKQWLNEIQARGRYAGRLVSTVEIDHGLI